MTRAMMDYFNYLNAPPGPVPAEHRGSTAERARDEQDFYERHAVPWQPRPGVWHTLLRTVLLLGHAALSLWRAPNSDQRV